MGSDIICIYIYQLLLSYGEKEERLDGFFLDINMVFLCQNKGIILCQPVQVIIALILSCYSKDVFPLFFFFFFFFTVDVGIR